jgi:methylmalonyl-CoA mutase N-terminal domain/subunit
MTGKEGVFMSQEGEKSEIREKMKAWENRSQDSFSKEPRQNLFSDSGIELKRLYTQQDLQERGFDYMRDLGFPGEYPFTRGIDPSMYRKEIPKFRQYSGFATPEESNTLFRNLIAQGQTGFSLAFDLPT